MRKILIITGMAMFFGMPNLAKGFEFSWGWSPNPKVLKKKTPPQFRLPEEYLTIIELLKKQIDLKEKQLSATEEAYNAITYDSIIEDQEVKTKKETYDSLFLKNSSSIYNKDRRSDASYQQILEEQKNVSEPSDHVNRNFLGRVQFTSVMDKAIALQALKASEKRLEHILSLLDEFKKAKNLKDIVDFQANVDGILAMIENESIKLQMVAQLRDAEYALIKTKRRELDLKVFNSTNQTMPAIRFQ
ncbi:type IV secretion system protein [Bartonella grahamii]|uniref:type IV secretion system protein n=1 Tax=Bartonella grahamii TaxID=33045 RepID=UPI002E7B20DD|nr:type IV secretion system protein [Bartonella grahamii]